MSTPERLTLSERMALARHRTVEARTLRGLPPDTLPMPLDDPSARAALARTLPTLPPTPAWQVRAQPGQHVVLMPGQLHFGPAAASLRTLLGSCVAVTLWHPERRIGGMCHFLLPARSNRVGEAPDGRYGDDALEAMVQAIKVTGTDPRDYHAHLYGGADTLPDGVRIKFNVGERNIEKGWSLIDQHGFQLQGVDVGEDVPRTVTLTLATGEVEMRRGTGKAPVLTSPAGPGTSSRPR
jgi:chemotaxis protein CheD